MIDIPDKHFFKIGEVARIVGVKPSVLRFWETEFKSIRPEKSPSNQRLYARRHVERLLEIKGLLYEQQYTIAGARRRLRDGDGLANGDEAPTKAEARGQNLSKHVIARLRKELEELLQLAGE